MRTSDLCASTRAVDSASSDGVLLRVDVLPAFRMHTPQSTCRSLCTVSLTDTVASTRLLDNALAFARGSLVGDCVTVDDDGWFVFVPSWKLRGVLVDCLLEYFVFWRRVGDGDDLQLVGEPRGQCLRQSRCLWPWSMARCVCGAAMATCSWPICATRATIDCESWCVSSSWRMAKERHCGSC